MHPDWVPSCPPDWQPCTHHGVPCAYHYWAPGTEYRRPGCCTRHLRNVTAYTEGLLTRHGIFHFLDWGSLLGAVRTGSLVPWDGDTDFAVLETDRAKIMALRDEIAHDGFLLFETNVPCLVRIQCSELNYLHADLWLHQVDDQSAWFDYYGWNSEGLERFEFPVSYLDNIGQVTLEGIVHPAPQPVKQFIADHRYGRNFMVPSRNGQSRVPPGPDLPSELGLQEIQLLLQEIDPSSRLFERCRVLMKEDETLPPAASAQG